MSISKYSEIRGNHFDDIEQVQCIDAWKTDNDNEEGKLTLPIPKGRGF